LVTSPKSEEGKTTVSLQLAESLARHGHRTLLVDADFRRPTVAKRYRIPAGHDSLLDHLETPEDHAPTQVTVAGATLDVIPNFKASSGPPLSRRLAGCLDLWKGTYDVIILDSAPLLPVADSFALAPLCTHAVLVANLRRSDRRSSHTAAERLSAMGIPLVGVVVMRVKQRLNGRQYRSYLRAGAD
jgi:Mrp family chromosome partitioning ATPase